MPNVDKILFNTNINSDTYSVSVDVSYFVLKKDKIIGDDIIKSGQKLIGVGICNKTGMINVCYLDGNHHKYFWVNSEDINSAGLTNEDWEFDDMKIHFKAIKEEWTIKKNKSKQTKKNTKNVLQQKQNNQNQIAKKETKRKKP